MFHREFFGTIFSAVSGVAISLQLVNSLRRNRAVVQLGRTLEWGSRGRGFESRRPEKFFATDYIDEHKLSMAENVIRVNPCSSVVEC